MLKRYEEPLLHGNVKCAILDVSASSRTHLRSDPTLESSGQKSLILQRQLRGYKTLDPTTKHQKAIPAKLVLNIYKRTDTHLNTAIGQLITGAFSSACGHASTPPLLKGRTNAHAFYLYRKRRELSHDSGILHLADKVSPAFRMHKNGVTNATVTQWRTTTTLCLLRIWAEIII